MTTTDNLIAEYKAIRLLQRAGQGGQAEAADMIFIAIELGKRGYTLTDDESIWVKKESRDQSGG